MNNKLNFKNIHSVFKKEISGYLDNPASYVVLIVFLTIWFFLFFRSAFIIGEASLTNLFGMFPWFGLVLISAITMGAIAKEKDDGTLEFVLTHPIRELEFILGKLFSAIAFVLFAGLFTFPIAIIFSNFSHFDWGVYASQLIGYLLFSSALVSIGIFLSSLFNSQIAALLSTLATGFLLIAAGTDLVTISMPFSVAAIFERVSLLSHYDAITRGVIDFYDVLYFLAVTIAFVLLTLLQLFKRKYGDYKARYSILQIVVGSLIIVAFLASALKVWLPLRLDITQGQIYTLSPQTKKVLKSINTPVNITLYASDQLPSQYAPVLRDLRYVLGDYKTVGGNKITIATRDPSKDPQEEENLAQAGIQKIQFNVVGQEELQVKTGYLGIMVTADGKNEVIPFVNATNDIEYQLTSLINKLTNANKPTVAFYNAGGAKTQNAYNYLAGELQKQFNVTTVLIDKDNKNINQDVKTLIIGGPTSAFDDIQKEALKEFLARGGNLVVLADSYTVSNSLNAQANTSNINEIIGSLGVTINKDVVFDLSSFSKLSFRTSNQTLVAPYPYWVISEIAKDNPIGMKYVQSNTTFWPSSLKVDYEAASAAGYTVKDLLTTTDNAGSDVNPPSALLPSDQYPAGNKGKKVLAVVLEPKNAGGTQGRIAVIGDSDFAIDALIQRNPENMSLGSGVVSWAAGIDSLADIQVKTSGYSLLKFKNAVEPAQIRYSAFAMIIIIPLVLALFRYTRRSALRYQKY